MNENIDEKELQDQEEEMQISAESAAEETDSISSNHESDGQAEGENEEAGAPEEEIPEGETRASYTLKKFIAGEGARKEAFQQNKDQLLSEMKDLIRKCHEEESSE